MPGGGAAATLGGMTTDVLTKVEVTVNVGSTPITGWVEDRRGHHAFAGWLELVTILAASVVPPLESPPSTRTPSAH